MGPSQVWINLVERWSTICNDTGIMHQSRCMLFQKAFEWLLEILLSAAMVVI